MLNEILNALKKYQGEPLMADVPDKVPALHISWKIHRLLPSELENRWKFQTGWSESTLPCCVMPILSVGTGATKAVIGSCSVQRRIRHE